jgi:hypothetical protein
MWSPFVLAVEPASTLVGGPTSSGLPATGCSTLISATGWGRVSVLQLWADWALLSCVSLASTGFHSQGPATTCRSAEGCGPPSTFEGWLCQLHYAGGDSSW